MNKVVNGFVSMQVLPKLIQGSRQNKIGVCQHMSDKILVSPPVSNRTQRHDRTQATHRLGKASSTTDRKNEHLILM